MSAEPKDFAQAIKATRDEFEAAFITAQIEFDRGAVIKSFKMIARNMGSDVEAFEAAFFVARQQGWLRHLVRACELNGLGTIALFRASDELQVSNQNRVGAAGEVQNQYDQPLIEPYVLQRLLPLLRAATCFINVGNGTSTGTGFLIGPDLIITAWHVVRSLFVQQAGEPEQPVENGAIQIEVSFDESPIQDRVAVKVAKDWHVAASSCHTDELMGMLPENLALLANHYDFAIIRLDDDPGRRRGWLRLEPDVEPRKEDTICIMQHPLQNSLRIGFGEFTGFVDPLKTRFFHSVRTALASSGGPCVNTRFQLVGLHQAGFKKGAGVSAIKRRNHAIVAAGLWDNVSNWPAPRPLWRLPNSAPVLARLNLQQAIGSLALGASKRILIVQGQPKTGKTFSLDILEASLPNAQHVILRLDAVEFPPRAEDLTRMMLAKTGVEPMSLPGEDDPGTTLDAYIKQRLIPALSEQMEKVLNGRLFWLAVDSLEKYKIPIGSAHRLLDMLYHIGSPPWLRVVLVGFSGTISDSNRGFVAEDTTEAPKLRDIEIYLRQRTAEMNSHISERELRAIAWEVDKRAKARRGPYIAALSAVLQDEGETLLAAFAQGAAT